MRPIDQDLFSRGKSLFLKALDVPPEARDAFLAANCGGDTALVAHVAGLLAHADAPAAGRAGRLLGGGAGLPLPDGIGRFRIHELLGEGGMGVVYRAQDPAGGPDGAPREVALKILRPGLLSPEALRRFRREAEALRRLDHPGIARLLETGPGDAATGGQPYLVMAYVPGVSLNRWRAQDPPETARIRLLAGLCDAVQAAHDQGIIHRDLKPENIVVTPQAQPVVLDFGIARLAGTDRVDATLATDTWQLLGTIRYMSPEQAEGGAVGIDARSDVYALGVIGYELLTGRLPYDLERLSTPRALFAVATQEPRPLGAHGATLSGDLELIVHHALAKRPADRYPSAASLAADLRAHLAGRPISLRRPAPTTRLRRKLRSQPRLRRALLGLAIAAAATITTTTVLRLLPAPGTPRPTLAHAMALLDEGDRRRHDDAPTPANLTAALELFAAARAEFVRLPQRPCFSTLSRYTYWRQGELAYFLGALRHDADILEQARGYWRDAHGLDPRIWTTAAGADPAWPVHDRVARLGRHHPYLGQGMASTLLAAYRAPVTNLTTALRKYEAGAALFSTGEALYPAGGASDELQRRDRADLALNEGDALASLGDLAGDPALIGRGLARLRIAAAADTMRDIEGRGYMAHARGRAHLARADARLDAGDTAGARADADSAARLLGAALDLRREDAGRAYWRLRRDRARLAGLGARLATTGAAARARQRAALAELRAGAAALRPEQDDFELAVTAADLGGIWSELGALAPGGPGFGRADSLFAAAAGLLTAPRFPVQAAELAWRRGRLARLRWTATGDAAAREAATLALTQAEALLPAAEWPGLHTRIRRETDALARGR